MSYEIKKTTSEKFMFNLLAANNQVVLTSQMYEQKESAVKGIDSVRHHGSDDSNFELKESSAGEPYFILKAHNGQTIGKSQMYHSQAAAQKGIESVKANCGSESVKDHSLQTA